MYPASIVCSKSTSSYQTEPLIAVVADKTQFLSKAWNNDETGCSITLAEETNNTLLDNYRINTQKFETTNF